jgi:hypothetical protein
MPWWIAVVGVKGAPRLKGPYLTEGRMEEVKDKLDLDEGVRKSISFSTVSDDEDYATRVAKEKISSELGYLEGTKNFSHRE